MWASTTTSMCGSTRASVALWSSPSAVAAGDGRKHRNLVVVGDDRRAIGRLTVDPDPTRLDDPSELIAVPFDGGLHDDIDRVTGQHVASRAGGLSCRREQSDNGHRRRSYSGAAGSVLL